MIISRFLGTLAAVLITDILLPESPSSIERFIALALIAVIGTGIGFIISIYLSPQGISDIPVMQDSLDFWEGIYPDDPETAKVAHKMWMDER